MTLLGVPQGSGFSIGTSSSIASPSGPGTAVDMSLDDMIKNRRRSQRGNSTKPKPTSADKAIGRGRANRQAKLNARRGLRSDNKANAMEIEKEIDRQARRSKALEPKKAATTPTAKNNRRSKRLADVKVKAKKEQKKKQEKKQQQQRQQMESLPPAWIGGTRRPPSKRAVSAAVNAMTDAGFKIPKGMQMVISFAPAPTEDPTKTASNNKNNTQKKGSSGQKKGGNQNQKKGGPQKKSNNNRGRK